jgi:glycosyltransferase involved in cell wall biosynthesis
VAAEAAACGALPVSAAHSGLAEVTRVLAAAVPPAARELLAFDLGPMAVTELAGRLIGWLEAPEPLRAATRDALVGTAAARWSWEGVADGVLAAARGELDGLQAPG